MKVLIDIGHPAHVHYFKNFLQQMTSKGHEFKVIAKDKEVTHKLLEELGINFTSRGKTPDKLSGKFINMFKMDYFIYKAAKKFKPDLMIAFCGIHISHVGKLLNIPTIVIDDTEEATMTQRLYRPFANFIISPNAYRLDFGKNHYKFNSTLEFTYLNPKVFQKDNSIFKKLGLDQNEKFSLIRFANWNAVHDVGFKGLSNAEKLNLIEKLKDYGKVFLSAEGEIPEELEKYLLPTLPSEAHQVLAHANLFYTESVTMAAEAAILGTPTIHVSSFGIKLGYIKDLHQKYKLLYATDDNDKGLSKAIEYLKNPNIKNEWNAKAQEETKNFEDFTDYLTQFINSKIKI